MPTPAMFIGQDLADTCTLLAQKYAGFFYGFEIRAGQHGTKDEGKVFVSDRPWREPFVRADDCAFCQVTTDERVRERIRGFQHAIDIEVMRGQYASTYFSWRRHRADTPELKRQFIEAFEEERRGGYPTGWPQTALNLLRLPFHLQRRLCVEWNHALRDWLETKPLLEYDFETREIRPIVTGEDLSLRARLKAVPDADEAEAMRQDLEDDYAYAATAFGGGE